jgi:hypothetical protein
MVAQRLATGGSYWRLAACDKVYRQGGEAVEIFNPKVGKVNTAKGAKSAENPKTQRTQRTAAENAEKTFELIPAAFWLTRVRPVFLCVLCGLSLRSLRSKAFA